MPRRNKTVVEEPVQEEVQEEPKEDLVILEYDGPSSDLVDQVTYASHRLVPGGALYLTLPYGLVRKKGPAAIVKFLKGLFTQVGPLNVGSNPRLANNDTTTRVGFLCLK
jgi:hypothetical protein